MPHQEPRGQDSPEAEGLWEAEGLSVAEGRAEAEVVAEAVAVRVAVSVWAVAVPVLEDVGVGGEVAAPETVPVALPVPASRLCKGRASVGAQSVLLSAKRRRQRSARREAPISPSRPRGEGRPAPGRH